MRDPLVLVHQAIDKGELNKLLLGEGEYNYRDRFLENPTDLTIIFINGFNEFVKNSKDHEQVLTVQLTKSLISFLNKADTTWWCLSILYSYLLGYKENALKFKIDVEKLIRPLNESLKTFENELKLDKRWVGYRFQEGLWHDVRYMVPKINNVIGHELKLNIELL